MLECAAKVSKIAPELNKQLKGPSGQSFVQLDEASRYEICRDRMKDFMKRRINAVLSHPH